MATQYIRLLRLTIKYRSTSALRSSVSSASSPAPRSTPVISFTRVNTVDPPTSAQPDSSGLHIERSVTSFRNSQGSFSTFSTSGNSNLDEPPETTVQPASGDLFIHCNTTSIPEKRQVWMYRTHGWEDITELWRKEKTIVHPTIAERVLTVNGNIPNWILRSSAEQKMRKSRAKSATPGPS